MLVRRTLTLGAAVAMLAACSQDEHSRLVQPGFDSWWGFVANEVGADEPFVLASEIRLCVDRPGRVEIVDVSLEHTAGGLAVDAFATDPMDVPLTEPDAESPTLWDYGFRTGPQLVGQQCTEDLEVADQARLGVQFSKPTAGTARGANLLIRYLSEGKPTPCGRSSSWSCTRVTPTRTNGSRSAPTGRSSVIRPRQPVGKGDRVNVAARPTDPGWALRRYGSADARRSRAVLQLLMWPEQSRSVSATSPLPPTRPAGNRGGSTGG